MAAYRSCSTKYIPRLMDATSSLGCGDSGVLSPEQWTVDDVTHFFRINDCGAYANYFVQKGTNGKSLLELSKDEIMEMIGFKIGPTLKIFDLIQQLKTKAYKSIYKKIL